MDPNANSMEFRKMVAEEMLEKEYNYVAVLKCLTTKFLEPLEEAISKAGRESQKSLLTKTECKKLFINVSSLLNFHVEVRDSLQAVISKWNSKKSLVGQVWSNRTEAAKLYALYIDNHYAALEVLDQCEKRPRFQAFIQSAESDPSCGKLRLRDMIIQPVQHIPHVKLQLEKLLKYTPQEHPDHHQTRKALKRVKKVLERCVLHNAKIDEKMSLMEKFRQIDNLPPEVIHSQINFLSSLDLEVINGTGGFIRENKGAKIRLLLFDRVVLFAKIRSRSRTSSCADLNESVSGGQSIGKRGTSFSAPAPSHYTVTQCISRQPSLRYAPSIKRHDLPLRFLSLSEFGSFRGFEYVASKGIFILQLSDETAYRLCIFRLCKKVTLKEAIQFFNDLIGLLIKTHPNWDEKLEELTEHDVKWPKNEDRREDYEMIAKAIDNTPDLRGDGTIAKRSLLNRTFSNISEGLAASWRRLTTFGSPTASLMQLPDARRDCRDDSDAEN